MEISLDFRALAQIVSNETDFVGTKTTAFTFEPKENGKVEISTGDDRRSIRTAMEGDASGFGKNKGLSVSADSLENLVKIRSKPDMLKIKASKGVVEFSAKTKTEKVLGYANVLPTETFKVEKTDKAKEYVEFSTKDGASSRLEYAASCVDLDPSVDMDQMSLWFRFDKDGMSVASRDRYHLAYFQDKRHTNGKRVEASIDKELFSKMQKALGLGDCTFFVSAREVVAQSENTMCRAASLQAQSENNVVDGARKLMDKAVARKNPDAMSVPKAVMDSLLGNLDLGEDSLEAVFHNDADGRLCVSTPVKKGKAGYVSTQSSVEVEWKEGTRHVAKTSMLKDILKCMNVKTDVALNFGEGELWTRGVDAKKDTVIFYVMLLQDDE